MPALILVNQGESAKASIYSLFFDVCCFCPAIHFFNSQQDKEENNILVKGLCPHIKNSSNVFASGLFPEDKKRIIQEEVVKLKDGIGAARNSRKTDDCFGQ